ncbi:hypothetical protein AB0B50_03570 [Streptomyces sp. NPDC041068]|uniref:hypothetical protein n=1 Tax=Streptomyces sp. NPDC041068 TaxID=3155130 RepID=UPI0033D58517
MTTHTRATASTARLVRAALALGAALAVFTALPTSTAYAATGTFFYHSPESGDLEMTDPGNGECRLLLQGADSASNQTDTIATVYFDQGCEESAGTLLPGGSQGFPEPIPHSVMFG